MKGRKIILGMCISGVVLGFFPFIIWHTPKLVGMFVQHLYYWDIFPQRFRVLWMVFISEAISFFTVLFVGILIRRKHKEISIGMVVAAIPIALCTLFVNMYPYQQSYRVREPELFIPDKIQNKVIGNNPMGKE